jgi:hypothetical protein
MAYSEDSLGPCFALLENTDYKNATWRTKVRITVPFTKNELIAKYELAK